MAQVGNPLGRGGIGGVIPTGIRVGIPVDAGIVIALPHFAQGPVCPA
jgi:hypothetical protein